MLHALNCVPAGILDGVDVGDGFRVSFVTVDGFSVSFTKNEFHSLAIYLFVFAFFF